MLGAAMIAITLALVLYSVGVWGEKLQKNLKPWHLVVFWAGLVCDAVGTMLMSRLATNPNPLNFHALTGTAAILLMLFHAAWATLVVVRNNERLKATFHKFSLVVWLIWLIPYLSGAFAGMGR